MSETEIYREEGEAPVDPDSGWKNVRIRWLVRADRWDFEGESPSYRLNTSFCFDDTLPVWTQETDTRRVGPVFNSSEDIDPGLLKQSPTKANHIVWDIQDCLRDFEKAIYSAEDAVEKDYDQI